MEFTSELNRADGICTVRVTGPYHRPADSDRLKRFAVNYAARHSCHRYLIDLTEADIIGDTMLTFDAADPRGAIAQALRRIKAAFVRRELSELDHFFENVAVNRGFSVRGFESIEAAVDWLEHGNR